MYETLPAKKYINNKKYIIYRPVLDTSGQPTLQCYVSHNCVKVHKTKILPLFVVMNTVFIFPKCAKPNLKI